MLPTLDKVGVSFLQQSSSYSSRVVCLCSCGEKFLDNRDNQKTCVCGNTFFKFINRPSKDIKTNIGGIFNCLESSHNSFKMRKREIIANIVVIQVNYYTARPENFSVTFTLGKEFSMDYSLRDKKLDLYRGDEQLEVTDKNLDLFFRGKVGKLEFVGSIQNEQFKQLLSFSFDKFRGYNNNPKWSTALLKLFEYPALELINNCGLGRHLDYIYDRHCRYRNDEHLSYTKPHELFGVPKYMMSYIKEMAHLGDNTLNAFRRFDKAFDSNTLKIIMQVFKEESTLDTLYYNDSIITELYTKYGYKDIKRLAIYLTRDLKLQQGILRVADGAILLRDYAKMCTLLGVTWEKYPKSLKKEHDVTMMNYKAVEDKMKNKKFQLAVETYTDLAYTTKKDLYEIIVPTTSSDLIKEGSALNHCIASYVDSVIEGNCKIVFMRLKENIEKPFVSIEIRDGNIRQARGQSNKSIVSIGMEEPYEFLKKWSSKMDLKISLH